MAAGTAEGSDLRLAGGETMTYNVHVVYGILHVHVHVHAYTCTCMDIDTTQSAAVCPLTAASWFTDTEC